jgi:hypothetical protein
MTNSQHRNISNKKKQATCLLQKSTSPQKKDLNDSEAGEISNNELKRIMKRMINQIQEDINNHLNEFKGYE